MISWPAGRVRFEELDSTNAEARRLAEKGSYAAQAVAAAVAEKPAGDERWARVRLPIESLQQAARLVLSLAPEAQALEPPALRAQVARWADELGSRHRD
mgnify:CR=1 FL=1